MASRSHLAHGIQHRAINSPSRAAMCDKWCKDMSSTICLPNVTLNI
jgi:hypothetical protein